jgi:hypothetical protein
VLAFWCWRGAGVGVAGVTVGVAGCLAVGASESGGVVVVGSKPTLGSHLRTRRVGVGAGWRFMGARCQ